MKLISLSKVALVAVLALGHGTAAAQSDESEHAELTARTQFRASDRLLQARYFFHNSVLENLVLFDQGDADGRPADAPRLIDEGDGRLTLAFLGSMPGHPAPAVPLGRKIVSDATGLNRAVIEVPPGIDRVRICTAYAVGSQSGYTAVEDYLKPDTAVLERQIVLCSKDQPL